MVTVGRFPSDEATDNPKVMVSGLGFELVPALVGETEAVVTVYVLAARATPTITQASVAAAVASRPIFPITCLLERR